MSTRPTTRQRWLHCVVTTHIRAECLPVLIRFCNQNKFSVSSTKTMGFQGDFLKAFHPAAALDGFWCIVIKAADELSKKKKNVWDDRFALRESIADLITQSRSIHNLLRAQHWFCASSTYCCSLRMTDGRTPTPKERHSGTTEEEEEEEEEQRQRPLHAGIKPKQNMAETDVCALSQLNYVV